MWKYFIILKKRDIIIKIFKKFEKYLNKKNIFQIFLSVKKNIKLTLIVKKPFIEKKIYYFLNV